MEVHSVIQLGIEDYAMQFLFSNSFEKEGREAKMAGRCMSAELPIHQGRISFIAWVGKPRLKP
jgi:hypothetical protein